MTQSRLARRALLALASFAWLLSAQARSPVEVDRILSVDFEKKIEQAMVKRERFAVDVAHVASPESSGTWETNGDSSVWKYTVRVPTAVSISFHASRFALPRSASLEVRDASGSRASYQVANGATGDLWGRIQRGDTLQFELRVATRDRAHVQFDLMSLQAGYRGLGDGVEDHPVYRKFRKQMALAASSSCVENFVCHETPQNSGNADATAAIVIGGVAQCTATLVTNLRNDGTPYLLTARHCQEGPGAGIFVYWSAVTPCGNPIGSVYNVDGHMTGGTHTVFEQQDIWLIELGDLSSSPGYYAGWDATGGTFVGGYSPHHALGRSLQYTGWHGQAYLYDLPRSVLGVGFDSTYWGMVNEVGSVGAGASGGGLFDDQHRLVGVASLGKLDDDGSGACPVVPAPVADSETATALYNALSAVWNTNSDSTSSTNPVTLKSLLDPDNSGAKVSAGYASLRGIYLFRNQEYASTGSMVTLSWNSGNASSCTATGGVTGDGWAGPRALNSSYDVTQFEPGYTNYTLTCTDGTRSSSRTLQIAWTHTAPTLVLSPSDSSLPLGATLRMAWRANVTPCTASGGSPGDGWAGTKPATGARDLVPTQAGEIEYTLNCGTGDRTIARSVTVAARAPVAQLTADANNMRAGQPVTLIQSADGMSCTRSGGAAGDGWAGSTSIYPLQVTSANAGNFTYTLTCTAGALTATASVNIAFTNDPPSATLTASPAIAEVSPGGPVQDITGSNPYALVLHWVSNVAACSLTFDGPNGSHGTLNSPAGPVAAASDYQAEVGQYTYHLSCGSGAGTATATTTGQFVAPTARVFLTLWEAEHAANQPFTLLWGSNTSPCVASGGGANDGWSGAKATSSGTATLSLTTPGVYTYALACGTAPDIGTAQVQVTIAPPAVAFAPHASSARVGLGVGLSWSGSIAPCTMTGDWSGTGWANGIGVAVKDAPGVYTFGVLCGPNGEARASTQVTYLPRPTVTISTSAASVTAGQAVTLTWSSTNTSDCFVPGSGTPEWSGSLPTSGTRTIARSVAGPVGFSIVCEGGAYDSTSVMWNNATASPGQAFSAPTVDLSVDHPNRVAGETMKLTWTSTHSVGCRGGGGVNGDGWAGSLPVSGTRQIIVNAAGNFSWDISCYGAPPSAAASVSVAYTAASPPPPPSGGGSSGGGSGSSSGGGGGGRFDPLLLAALGALLMLFRARGSRPRLRR